MAYAGAAADIDRLPWLSEEPKPTPRKGKTPALWTLGIAAAVAVAGTSYWLGVSSVPDSVADEEEIAVPSATLVLPKQATDEDTAPQVPIAAPPQVERPRVTRPVTIRRAPEVQPRINHIVANPEEPPGRSDEAVVEEDIAAATGESTENAVEAEKAVEKKPLTYWPAVESTGAEGRVVRIGTFSNRLQAKKAWWKVVKVYPGMNALKAVVAPIESQRNGRTYYRLQFGTTSQAHSEILCQRMRIVGQSCVVVGVSSKNQGG